MENVILLIHLLLTLALIAVVLLQRSEGGGLGMGGGGGNGAMSGRSAGTAMGKITWILGLSLFATSITLTIISAKNSAGSSVLDRITDAPAAVTAPTLSDSGDSLLPPPSNEDGPVAPAAD